MAISLILGLVAGIPAEFADNAAEPRFAWVAVGAPGRILGGVHPHGAELIHHKCMIMQSHPLLLKDDRPRAGQLDARWLTPSMMGL